MDRLTAKGLVERRTCEEDRRARYAALTPAGNELVARIFPEHAALLTAVMEGLTVEEQSTAADLVRTLGLFAAGDMKPDERDQPEGKQNDALPTDRHAVDTPGPRGRR